MKRALGAILALLCVAGVALALTFTSSTLETSPLPALTPPDARPPAAMKLLALPSGTMRARAGLAFRGGSFAEERTFAMGGILVMHPQGNLLFDAGFGRKLEEHLQALPFPMRAAASSYTKGTPVIEQLAKLGIQPQTLKGVVLTHAHWDHVSGLDDMRRVPVLLPRAELDFVRSGHRSTTLLRSFGPLDYRVYDFEGGPYLGFEKSHDVFGDGSVVLVAAGGHTPGSVIAFIYLPDGKRYALVGDVVWQAEGIALPAERPWLLRRLVDVDELRLRTVIVRLHALKQRDPALVIVPAHDARVWASLPRPPAQDIR
jgi:glyoxylase-like metal-dependent hydrolase (beta-lactamase superfamily II)